MKYAIQFSGDPANLGPFGLLIMIIVFFVVQAVACDVLGASGQCTDECDCPCPDGGFCFFGECVQKGLDSSCIKNSECPPDTMCMGGQCKCLPKKEGSPCTPGHPCGCPIGLGCEQDEQGDTVCKCPKGCVLGSAGAECGDCCGCVFPLVCNNGKCSCPTKNPLITTLCGMGTSCDCSENGVESDCNRTMALDLKVTPPQWKDFPTPELVQFLDSEGTTCAHFACIVAPNGQKVIKRACGCGQPAQGKSCECKTNPAALGCVW